MTFLRSLARRSVENPNVPLSSHALSEWLNGPRSDAGVAVTEQRVLGLPAYYRGLALTAGTIGALPLHRYEVGTRKRATSTNVLDKPNPRQTEIEFRITLMLHAVAWGNGFAFKVLDQLGRVREVWPIHPSNCRVEDVPIDDRYPDGKRFWIRRNGIEKPYSSRFVFHLPYMSMDGMVGIRPLQVFRQSLGLAIAGDDSAARTFKNGSRPSGILTTDKELDDEGVAAGRLKQRWKELLGGVENTGEIGVLDNGATFTPVSIPPIDAQLLESRQWTISEIARMTGSTPELLGDRNGSSMWGTGQEQIILAWLKFTLGTWITSLEQRYKAELLPAGEYCKHSLEGLLRGDSAARAAFYHSGITDGWLVRNEVREYEDLDPIDGLDDPIVPSNMTVISIDQNGQIIPLSSAGTTAAGTSA